MSELLPILDARYVRQGDLNIYNWHPRNTGNITKDIADVKAGTRRAAWAKIGDSTVCYALAAGSAPAQYANGLQDSWPIQLAVALEAQGIPVNLNAFLTNGNLGSTANYTAYNPKVTFENATWTTPNGWFFSSPSPATDEIRYQPSEAVDTLELYYARVSTGGEAAVKIGGVAMTGSPVATAGTPSKTAKATLTFTLGTGLLTAARNGVGGDLSVQGMCAYNSAVKQIDLYNVGVSGQKASQWNSTSAWTAKNLLDAIDNLSVLGICLGINDAIAGDIATFSTNIGGLIDYGQARGANVILYTMNPFSTTDPDADTRAEQQAYVDVIFALMASKNVPLVDFWGEFGTFAEASTGQSLFVSGELIHPSVVGNAVKAALAVAPIGIRPSIIPAATA